MASASNEVDRLIQDARLQLSQGSLDSAVQRAGEAIRQDARATAAYLIRAEAHRRLKRHERALADLAVAIRLAPDRAQPYVIRAEILKKHNRFDQAIADATQAILLKPDLAAAYAIRGECRRLIGDMEGAQQDAEELFRLDPTRPMESTPPQPASTPSPAFLTEEDTLNARTPKRHGDERDLFADGKPVDKTYRSSREVVSDDEAPEVLGVASGYKPGVIGRPIPRIRSRGKGPQVSPILVGLVCLGLLGGGYAFISQNRNSPDVKPTTVLTQPQPPEVANTKKEAKPIASLSPTPASHSERTQALPSLVTPAAVNSDLADATTPIAPTEEPLSSLRGTWLAFTEDAGGKRISGEEMLKKQKTLKVVDDTFSLSTTYYRIVGTIRAVPKDGANAIDLDGKYVEGGDGKSLLLRGIYEIENGTLRLCYSYNNEKQVNERPTSFDTGGMCVSFKRVDGRNNVTSGTAPRSGEVVPSIESTRRLEGHTGIVLGAAFSPDSKWLATASGDSTVRLWNTAADGADNSHVTLGTGTSQLPKTFISVAFSPDGKLLAASNMDGRIFLWDSSVIPPRLLRTLNKHDDPVMAITFSPDGKTLATGGRKNGLVCIWDLTDPNVPLAISIPPEKNGVLSLAYSPDGKSLFQSLSYPNPKEAGDAGKFVTPGQIWVWDLSRRPYVKRLVLRDARSVTRTLVFSPDGKHVAFGDAEAIRILDATTGKVVKSIEKPMMALVSIAYTPDGKYLLSGGFDKTARLWDVETGQVVLEYGDSTKEIEPVAVSPDGRFAAIGGHEMVIRLLKLKSVNIRGVAFGQHELTPPGTPIVEPLVRDLGSFSTNKAGRTWNVVIPEHFTKAEVVFYRGDPSDLTLNAAWEGHLQINGRDVVRFSKSIDAQDGNVFVFHDSTSDQDYEEKNDYKKSDPKRYLDVTKYLRPGDNSFFYYHEQRPDLPMGLILRLTGSDTASPPGKVSAEPTESHTLGSGPRHAPAPAIESIRRLEGHTGVILGAAFSPDSKWLATAAGDATVRLWDVAAGGADDAHITLGTRTTQPPKAFISVAYSPDGSRLAASNIDGRVFLWDNISTPPRLLTILEKHDDPVVAIAFSPDGKILATGGRDKGLVCFWDLTDATISLKTSISSQQNGVWSLAYSPDGRTLIEGVSFPAAGNSTPGQIWVWDVDKRPYMKRSVIEGFRKTPRCIAFSPDGSTIACVDGDVVRVLDARSGKAILFFEKHTEAVGGVAYLPGGKYLLSGGYDKMARLWDAKTGEQVLEYGDVTEAIEPVAVSPDGRLVAVAGHEKSIRLIRLRPPAAHPTRVGATSPPNRPATSSAALVEIAELKPPDMPGFPTLTGDGLILCYESNGVLWMAKRNDSESMFRDKAELFPGRHPALSSDGKELILLAPRSDGQQGTSLHAATRDTTEEHFRRPKEIAELQDEKNPKSPWLSPDGRTLLFSHGRPDGNGMEIVLASRNAPDAPWGPPRPLALTPSTIEGSAPSWASLSDDGLRLFCCRESDRLKQGKANLMIWSRERLESPFSKPTFIEISGMQSLVGRSPRYLTASKELFFTMMDQIDRPPGRMRIFVVRNFVP